MEYAKTAGATTVAMCGFKGGKIKDMADIIIHANVQDMEVTEDVHMAVFNMVKKTCMHTLMGDTPSMGEVYDKRLG
jgi:D-sedoheptulose 7-phosphate isomerase